MKPTGVISRCVASWAYHIEWFQIIGSSHGKSWTCACAASNPWDHANEKTMSSYTMSYTMFSRDFYSNYLICSMACSSSTICLVGGYFRTLQLPIAGQVKGGADETHLFLAAWFFFLCWSPKFAMASLELLGDEAGSPQLIIADQQWSTRIGLACDHTEWIPMKFENSWDMSVFSKPCLNISISISIWSVVSSAAVYFRHVSTSNLAHPTTQQ